MTITEATNNILVFFKKNDCANIQSIVEENFDLEHLKKINGPLTREVINGIYGAAFEKLVKLGVCEPVKDTWVLVKHLENWPQQIEVNGILAVSLAQVLNELSEFYDSVPSVDASNITEKDLENLIMVAYQFLQHVKKENEKDE